MRILIVIVLSVQALFANGMKCYGNSQAGVSEKKDIFRAFTRKASVQDLLATLGDFNVNDQMEVFPFQCGEGNFVIAVYSDKVTVLDAGSNGMTWENFRKTNNELLTRIFRNRQLTGVIVTSPSTDCFNYSENLFEFVANIKKVKKLPPVTFFTATSNGNDCMSCLQVANKFLEPGSTFVHPDASKISRLLEEKSEPKAVFGAGLELSLDERKSLWKAGICDGKTIKRVSGSNDGYDADKALSECFFGKMASSTGAHFLAPIPIMSSSNSDKMNISDLVFRLKYENQTILFTGDNTGDALIPHKAKGRSTKDNSNNENVAKFERYNRNLLQSVNVTIGRRYDSNTKWLRSIIEENKNNFVGAVFSTQYTFCSSQIKDFATNSFPDSARTMPEHKIMYVDYSNQNNRNNQNSRGRSIFKKQIKENLFLTKMSHCGTLWISMSNTGMFMFSEESKKLEELVSEKMRVPTTQPIQHIIDDFLLENRVSPSSPVNVPSAESLELPEKQILQQEAQILQPIQQPAQPEVQPDLLSNMVGLRNLGATCYANAVFQALFSCSKIREIVADPKIRETVPGKELIVLLENFFNQMEEYKGKVINAESEKVGEIIHKGLIDIFQEISKHLKVAPSDFGKSGKVSEDATELLGAILDGITENNKVFQDIFHTTMAYCITCPNCNMEKEAQRPMNILQLTLKETDDDKESSIEECVKKTFYNKETLDNENEYWCECNEEEPVNAICESKLEKLPDILFLQLNRFKYDNSDKNKNEDKNKKIRINSKVSFDRNLDLELKDGTKESYELRAVVNHLGNHYTTFRRDGDVWYELNDSFFSVFARSDDEFKKRLDEIDPKSCLSYKQEAYIFLYEKKKKQ